MIKDMSFTTEDKIKGFKNLEKGWHYGRGIKFSDKVINQSLELLEAINLAGYSRTDAFPGLDGEIELAIYNNDVYCVITLESDENWKFNIIFENDDEELFEASIISVDSPIFSIISLINIRCSTNSVINNK